ncbi:hypothetical protein QVD17_00404 [Tagetes erecta]|uniref:Uncharacterized protein n=1 Tax=Tagetes erecta TaxID=13708 RepID=A0AAD8P0K6_TARER|nr:hypothetical protein QVD17_00404 [Tagetes erecta]
MTRSRWRHRNNLHILVFQRISQLGSVDLVKMERVTTENDCILEMSLSLRFHHHRRRRQNGKCTSSMFLCFRSSGSKNTDQRRNISRSNYLQLVRLLQGEIHFRSSGSNRCSSVTTITASPSLNGKRSEHLELCCFATVLFLAAAACPYVVHKAYVKPVQHVFALVAFPLVQK